MPRKPQRLEPPADFSLAEIKIWNQLLDTMPADFFTPDNEFVLRELVAGAVAEKEGQR